MQQYLNRRVFTQLCTLIVACSTAWVTVAEESGPTATADNSNSNIFAAAIEFAQQRCVKIYGAGIGREPGYATGIIISADGRILTASGIFLAGNRIRVVLPDGTMHLAQVERRSEALQAAILKIDANTYSFFEVPAIAPVQKGDWIVAVSNLFKVADGAEELSVNLGVLSLRTQLDMKRGTQDVPYQGDVLLIDAITSNPGAPGGALVNIDGQLVGMVGKVIESTSTNTKLNYAIPVDLLRKFLDGETMQQVASATSISEKPVVGIRLFTLSGRRAPAYVDRVTQGSLADRAGVKKDDLVLSIAGETVRNVGDYLKAEANLTPGEPIPLLLKRKDKVLTLQLEPASAPGGSEVPPIDTQPMDEVNTDGDSGDAGANDPSSDDPAAASTSEHEST